MQNIFHFLVFVIASFVLLHIVEDIVGKNPQNQVEPEEVHSLQTSEQREGNDLADPALVLLRLPVQLVRSDGTELGQAGPEDLQVDKMSEVDPYANEQTVIRHDD